MDKKLFPLNMQAGHEEQFTANFSESIPIQISGSNAFSIVEFERIYKDTAFLLTYITGVSFSLPLLNIQSIRSTYGESSQKSSYKRCMRTLF